MTKITKFTQISIILVAGIIALIYGKSFLIPLIFSLILWILIKKLKSTLNKIKVLREFVPNWVKNALLTFIIALVVYFVSGIISSNISTMVGQYDVYEANFNALLTTINESFGIDLKTLIGDEDISSTLSDLIEPIVSSLTSLVSNAFMIILYLLFIFLEETNFGKKLRLVFKEDNEFKEVSSTLIELEESISNYLGVKTLVSLITGALSAVTLSIIGVDAPVFWGLIIFILNYIPTIGSLIGTLFPAAFCLLQFTNTTPFILTVVIVGLIQVIVGNILEPKLVGNSMNLSALVAILALSLWGLIWGTTGMILSVPITVIMVIIFSKFKSTKPVAIMLSDKGEI
ncbi:AI-2E family transporter [Aquimarina sp. D1M17]|uniref:AI-2E family transporter n=1 Tax=Aquimarina acroporae TaxID=2937283 RepID=UPI0020C1459B|nr:AI-2E family transporter [Aquimarina acroporae]MCK8521811.1 AI-2E family transporter [Aquimarina acroporae]